jgi:flagellar basal-body rod protein FlgC
MFDVLDMGASGLQAQRIRMDTVASNILNVNTTHNERGEAIPYRRRFVVFTPGRSKDPAQAGVRVSDIRLDKSPFRMQYEPGHPDADSEGYVRYPNIDLSMEYVNALDASRAYEANVTMMETTKAMINASLRLLA